MKCGQKKNKRADDRKRELLRRRLRVAKDLKNVGNDEGKENRSKVCTCESPTHS